MLCEFLLLTCKCYSLIIVHMEPHEIRAALVLAKTTITAIAAQCGVKPPAVHQVINNERPNHRIREAIAETIGRPVEEIWPEAKPATQEAA